MKTKTKKKTNTYWRKKCVDIAKKIVRIRDNNTCVWCGNDGRFKQLHGSHVFPEGRYTGMSANVDNIKMLCAYCHIRRWHESPLEGMAWFKEKYPKRYIMLKKLSQQTIQKNWEKEYELLKKQYDDVREMV
jgi:5-methylcytosine-specific restriction endonuclease McrA